MTYQLDELRIRPITVQIPFPQAGRHVHFYLVEDSRPALFDTGLSSPGNEKWIERTLNQHGYALSDIKRVFLTHGHVDHYGNALLFQKLGAEIFMHPGDFNKVTLTGAEETLDAKTLYGAEFLKHGFPGGLIEQLEKIMLAGSLFARTIAQPTPVQDGDRFTFDRFDVRVVAVPGHTPGCVAYFMGDSGVAVTGDHLLQHISPNPLFELSREGEKFPSLVSYFASLHKILKEKLTLAMPAHGPFVTDAPALVESLTAFYRKRQAKIFNMMAAPSDAFGLCQTYYPRLKEMEAFLGFSEILGNLDMMVERGEVVLEEQGGRYMYRREASGH